MSGGGQAAGGDSPAGPEGGRRRLYVALALAAGIGAVVALLLAFGGQSPPAPLPDDLVHRAAWAGPMPARCLACHARPDGSAALSPNHTSRQDCKSCHAP